MWKSMTGFGRSEGETGLGRVSVELRSINHRFCDVTLKLPKRLGPFENRLKEMIRASISRGKIDVTLRLDSSGEGRVQFAVDSILAGQYYGALRTLKENLQLPGEITLDMLVGARDIITAKEELDDVEPYWNEIVPLLQQSIRQIDEMKRSEGESLARDIERRFSEISHQLQQVKQQFPKNFEGYRARFRERLQALLQGTEVDSSRFEQEVALLADRMDITEEIVRAESHLAQINHVMNKEETVGRKMEFLIQEIHREVNTISNKANDAGISQRVVAIKSELEKIREQVQNIE
jgi:uncharacterized protein (TIGR00255 family)